MKKGKVLITGGSGYIGSVLTPTLLDNGYFVTVLDNLMYNQTSLINHCSHPNFKFIKADVTDYSFMKKELQNHDIIIPLAAIVGAPACGDVMVLQIKVENDIIQEAKFKTYGCGSAIASSSLITEWVKGKTLDEAAESKNTDIVAELALSPVKIHRYELV